MQRPSWYFHRLRSMDLSEILWRVRSLLSAQLDFVRFPLRWYPRPAAEQRDWQRYQSSGFGFSVLTDKFSWNDDQAPFDGWTSRLYWKADRILKNELSFFDLEDQDIGDPINWHRDWSAGKTAPIKLSNLIDYRDFSQVGDCKLVWEPNRHHQFVVLARAYKLSGREEYAQKVVDLMRHWIEQNPVGYGMNWKSPLELGIRLINWVWAIDLIRESAAINNDAWPTIIDSFYATVWDVQRKFSAGSSANNHLIGEAAGVFVATCYFDDLPNATLWNETSRQILEREILNQSFADGCTREHAFGYQFFVVQFLTLCALAGERSGQPLSDAFMARLHEIYRFMASISADTGRQPNMGDADSGYVLDLGELPDAAASELISVGGHLFGDGSLMAKTRSETAYWLFGDSDAGCAEGSVTRSSQAFPESGYFVMRSEPVLDRADKRLSVVVDCAELGYGNIAAHGHADCLSFTLNIGPMEFLVDPGTYDYFSHPEWRQYFRMTRAHNTVSVDDLCQSVSLGPFLWGARANAKIQEWSDTRKFSEICAQHDGYLRLPDPVLHKRSIRMDKIGNSVSVADTIDCKGGHLIQRYFHLAPECAVEQGGDTSVTIKRDEMQLDLEVDNGSIRVVEATEGAPFAWVSRGYHSRAPSHCIVIVNEIEGPTVLGTALSVG